MTTNTWTSSISTSWSNTTGWSEAKLPTNGESVYINPGTGGAVTLSTAGAFTNSALLDVLTMDGAAANTTLLMASASTTILNLNTVATSGLVMSAGTITLQGSGANNEILANVVSVSGTSQINLSTQGELLTKTSLTLSGGTIAVTSSGQLDVGFTSLKTAGGTGGAILVGGTGLLSVSGGTLSATALNAKAGTLTETGGTIVVSGAASFSGGTDSLNGGILQADTAVVSNTITFGGGTLNGVTGGVVNSGTLNGFGTIQGVISGSAGSVIATGGILEITNNINAVSNFLNIGSGSSVLKLDGTETTGNTITFVSASSGALELNGATAVGGVTNSLTNFGTAASSASVSGDNFINVQGVTVGKIVVEGVGTNIFDGKANVFDIEDGSNAIIGKITLASSPLAGIAVVFGADSSVGTGSLGGTDIFLAPACFAAGTLIETTQGEVAVEDLTAGDLVVTIQDGQPVPMPVKWMGVRTIDIAAHPHPHLVAPVRIRAGAFGDDLPRRDLVVSTAHAIYADGKLVPANLLINNMTIVQELKTESVTYYHVELDRHSLILAEGLVSESYLDTGNRAIFSNAGLPTVLHPEFHVNAGQKIWEENACAPLAVDAETIAPIWHALAARAEALGHVPPRFTTTLDADVYLEADGRRLRPVAVAHGRHTFMLPAGTGDIVLRSRTSAPADLDPLTGDWRPLGVAVRSMTLHDGDDRIVIPADHPALTQGWHTPEAGNGSIWRWTAGNATIPVKGIAVPTMLDIEIGSTATYILTRSDREAQRLAA